MEVAESLPHETVCFVFCSQAVGGMDLAMVGQVLSFILLSLEDCPRSAGSGVWWLMARPRVCGPDLAPATGRRERRSTIVWSMEVWVTPDFDSSKATGAVGLNRLDSACSEPLSR